jgi:hypothetical protein
MKQLGLICMLLDDRSTVSYVTSNKCKDDKCRRKALSWHFARRMQETKKKKKKKKKM